MKKNYFLPCLLNKDHSLVSYRILWLSNTELSQFLLSSKLTCVITMWAKKKKKKKVSLISHQVGDQVQHHVTLLTIEPKHQGNVRWRCTEFIWNSVNVIFIPDWIPSATLENPELGLIWSVTIRNIKSLGTSICCVSCCLDLTQQHL